MRMHVLAFPNHRAVARWFGDCARCACMCSLSPTTGRWPGGSEIARDAHACARFPQPPCGHAGVRRLREMRMHVCSSPRAWCSSAHPSGRVSALGVVSRSCQHVERRSNGGTYYTASRDKKLEGSRCKHRGPCGTRVAQIHTHTSWHSHVLSVVHEQVRNTHTQYTMRRRSQDPLFFPVRNVHTQYAIRNLTQVAQHFTHTYEYAMRNAHPLSISSRLWPAANTQYAIRNAQCCPKFADERYSQQSPVHKYTIRIRNAQSCPRTGL